MIKKLISLVVVVATLFSCKDEHNNLPAGMYAEIKTDKGDIIAALDFERTPVTVANFVTLAEGKNPFVKPELKGKPLYDGLKFHRVIKDFMIQGGDPNGDGTGDAGYKFKDEITDLRFDQGGLLAMANSGPGTNGSQFFITHVPTPHLNGLHTIFGRVIGQSMDVVNKIEQDDKIISITIVRIGAAAKKFDGVKIFTEDMKAEVEDNKIKAIKYAEEQKLYEEKHRKVLADKVAYFASIKGSTIKTKSGLQYKIIQNGKGKKPSYGSTVMIDYAGYFENGMLFDSSKADVSKAFGKYEEGRAAQNGYTPIAFQAGRKEGMIPGFLEALDKMNLGDKMVVFIPSNLAYGEAGAGNGVIPPNTNLIFEIDLLDTKKK